MSGYILCQIPRAEHPYYIENISTNIYSIEELCYYFYHNLYLLDETILNEQLAVWLRDELGLKKLYLKLKQFFEEDMGIGWFLLPVFKEINYLNQNEMVKLNEELKKMEEQPEAVRMKLKGDALVQHRKYVRAIRVYQETLEKSQEGMTGRQFTGSVYHNMGCAYSRLFQMEEALDCFKQAFLELHTKSSQECYLYAVWMVCGKQVYEKELEATDADEEMKARLGREIKDEQTEQPVLDKDALVKQWIQDYHKNTDL